MKRVVTVLGEVNPGTLGFTQTHEHLLCDLARTIRPPGSGPAGRDPGDAPVLQLSDERVFAPLTLENHDWIKRNVVNVDNLSLTDEELATEELQHYRDAGGGTLVESSSIGLGRSPEALARMSRSTGVTIVMGCGYYTHAYQPPSVDALTVEQLTQEMVQELEDGVADTGIRPGIIGEIGLSSPLHPTEAKVLRAAVAAQHRTGAPLQIHPGRSVDGPEQAIDIVRASGGDTTRVVMCHVERTLTRWEDIERLARTGCYLEFDLFGQESSSYAFSDIDMPNDAMRLDLLHRLADSGHQERLLISQDICQKVYLRRFGGPGYAHILDNVVPVMRRKRWSPTLIEQITRVNPARMLTWT